MINHQRTPGNLLSYANYALPSTRRMLHPPPSMYSSSAGFGGVVPSMQQLYAHTATAADYQPPPPPHHHMHLANSLQQQQQTTAAPPTGYQPSSFRHHHLPQVHPHHQLSLLHHPRNSVTHHNHLRHFNNTNTNMAFTPQMSDADIAEMQKLSEGWKPEINVSDGRAVGFIALSQISTKLIRPHIRDHSSANDCQAQPLQKNMPLLIRSTSRRLP